ncbi:hypothetical protein [Microbacterium sp.]|uniref:hypothetical protein n=1 Tax=Microbacterium sp. TaxID=51671 RepID=UPI002E374ABE|nr:hypothetical protein [Microbacterium sp.]HEX5729203.1 hypothetical protein [Microbacterium sp.]
MNYEELVERWRTFDVSASIYRVDPALGSLDDVAALAGRAGLTQAADQDWNDMGPLLELEEEPYVFTVYRASRAVQYVDSSRWQVDDGTTAMGVSDADAIAAATREIERLELTDEATFMPTKVARLNVASSVKNGVPVDTRVIDVGVVFSRVIDGLTVEGQGGKVVMYLDAKLEPTGFERINRRIAVHEPVAGWRQLDSVIAEVEGYWRARFGDMLDIDDARLCYVELGRLEDQEYIQPAYALSLTLRNQVNGEERTVEHYVLAATNGIGTLMPTDLGPPSARRTA